MINIERLERLERHALMRVLLAVLPWVVLTIQ